MQETKLLVHRELASTKYFIKHEGIKLFIVREGKTPFGWRGPKEVQERKRCKNIQLFYFTKWLKIRLSLHFQDEIY